MSDREWKEGDHEVFYFYNLHDGRIVGQINKITHTKVWISKILQTPTEEAYLGQYISYEYAKRSVENYWVIQERTLIE